ncbi:glycosyltransferase family 2 protein [Cyclobacterium xiamenense]|uniref:glycosyltransferase family 2 protein n=1 Tax=Cyclobacterium xiamenense TaxID=1297121 RepID=UPI0012B833B3|nr:glycosyltransferase family 2 protein [Cyclobacterium xiamenense]
MRVSIVLACRDNRGSLKMTVKSILRQSYKEFELIIVDDGSKIPIHISLSDISDPRIRIYRIDGQGLGAALNYGISKSTGDYIARIDDDDLMDPQRIQKQVSFLDNNRRTVCVGTQLWFKSGGRYKAVRRFPVKNDAILDDLLRLKFSIAHCAVMYRRSAFEAVGGYRILGGGQDLDLFLQFSKVGELANLDEFLTYYNLSLSGLSVRAPKNKYKAYLFALNSIANDSRFVTHRSEISGTINVVLTKLSSRSNYLFATKRFFLIWGVWLFGKNIASNLKVN